MGPALLALALMAQPEACISSREAQALAAEVVRAERRHGLPAMLLAAVVLAESGGGRLVAREQGGHCSVGPAQVLVRDCDRARRRRMLVLATNLDAGASILARSRETCRRHPAWAHCRRSRWAGYNARSSGWWPRVARIWARLRAWRSPDA